MSALSTLHEIPLIISLAIVGKNPLVQSLDRTSSELTPIEKTLVSLQGIRRAVSRCPILPESHLEQTGRGLVNWNLWFLITDAPDRLEMRFDGWQSVLCTHVGNNRFRIYYDALGSF